MLWEEILEKSPTMKQIFQDKVQEEINKKQVEIDGLKAENVKNRQDNAMLQQAIVELTMLLGGMF